MALSEFMPYGAPELLDGASRRMARSTMLASAGVALMVAMLGAIAARNVSHEVVIPPDITRCFFPEAFKNVAEYRPQAPSHTPRVVDPNANVRPVDRPDLPERPLDPFVPPDAPPGDGPIADDHARVPPGAGPPPSDDPPPTQWVNVDELPVLVHSVQPRYPELARDAGVEGTVVVQMLVDLDGRVKRAEIAPKGSVPMLDEAALEAARACRFTPALANGHPVKVWVRQLYRFRLHN